MNIKQIKRTLRTLPPKKSVMIMGGHGLGKSQVVKQLCREMSVDGPYELIDIRLSQREVGDIIGMPRRADSFTLTKKIYNNGNLEEKEVEVHNVTLNDLPSWFPQDKDSRGFLFLDELNRASREVQQAVFELALDYRLNQKDLPEGWRVISAINEDSDKYAVVEVDPALMDRFMTIPFRPTVPEWEEHAREIGVHDAIVKYISKFPSDLDTPEDVEPGKIYQSRRSWVDLSDVIRYKKDHGDDVLEDYDYLTFLSAGYLGTTLAINFVEFIKKDYKVLTPEEILNRYDDEMERFFGASHVTELTFYNKELVKYIKENGLSKKQSENLKRYYKAVPKEAAMGFWDGFLRDSREEATKWYKNTEGIAEYTLEALRGKKLN